MFPVPSCFSCISVPLFSAAASNSKSPKQDGQVQFQKIIPILCANRNPETGPSKAHKTISVLSIFRFSL